MAKDLKAKVVITAEGDKAVQTAKKVGKELKDTGTKGKKAGTDIDQASVKAAGGLNKLGSTAKQTGTKVAQAGNEGSTGLNKMGSAANSADGQLNTLATSALGLGQAVTGVTDAVFGLQASLVGLEKTGLGIERMTVNIRKAQEDLTTAIQEGTISERDKARATEELGFMMKEAQLETKQLAADTRALDGQMVTIGINTAAAAVQSGIMILALIAQKKTTDAVTRSIVAKTGVTAASVPVQASSVGVTVAQTGANFSLAASLRAAAIAMKTFMLSNPVTAAALIASTAAVVAYESNLGGFRDGIEDLTGQERGSLPTLSGALGLTETKTDDAADSLEDYMEAAQRFADQVDNKQTPAVEGLGKAADNTTSSITKLTAASNRFASSSGFRLASITGGENGEKGIPLALGRIQAASSLIIAMNQAGLSGGNAITRQFNVGRNITSSASAISTGLTAAVTNNRFINYGKETGASNFTSSLGGSPQSSASSIGTAKSVNSGGGSANRHNNYQALKAEDALWGGNRNAQKSLSELTGMDLSLKANPRIQYAGYSEARTFDFHGLGLRISEARARVSLSNQIRALDPFRNDSSPRNSSTFLRGILAEEQAEINTNSSLLGVPQTQIISLQSTQQGNIQLNGMLDFRERMGLIGGGVT